MPISGPGTKIPGVKDAETPVPTSFKKVRAGDRVVLLLKGSHGGRYTGKCESQASSKMSLSGTIYFTEDQKTGGLKRSISKGELDFVTEDVLGCWVIADMVSITWHTRNTWEYTGKKGGFGRKGYVACTGGYECIIHNACIGGLGNTSSLPIVMINVVFENTPFWALGVYGRILKAPIPQYTAVYSGVYGRILRVYGRILGVFVCTR